jgi:uncharacterized protein
VLRPLVLFFTAALAVFPLDLSKLKPQGYLSDFAGVVDARGKGELERYSTLVEQKTGAQMAFVTLDTLDGEPVEDVANKLYEQWGIGNKKNEGALLLLVIRDRRSRLEIGYGLEPILPDGLAGSVLREMRPALRDKEYSDALIAAAAELGAKIAGAKGVTLDGSPEPRKRRESDGIPPVLIIVGVVAFILFIKAIGSNKGPRGRGPGGNINPLLWALLMSNRSSGRWPRSGGGFGGYDSGGGFGGFGGGHSGGGGASGSW